MNGKKLTLKYCFQHLIYWATACGIVSFAATYLLSKGFTAAETGRILFMANLLSFLLQPVVAGAADKAEKNIIPAVMLSLAGITLVCFACIRFLALPGWLFFALYVAGATSLDMQVPMLNAENVYYTDRGWRINYGLARAVGSAAYAVLSLCMGYIMEDFGADWMPVIALALIALYIGALLLMPRDDSLSERHDAAGETASLPAFFAKYKWYCISLSGVLLLAFFHVMTENYLIQILGRLGGDSSGVGIALCIATVAEAPALVLFGSIHKKIGSYRVFLVAGFSYCLKALLFIMARSVTAIYLTQILQVTTYTFLSPVQMYYAKECTEETDMVKGQSVITAAYTLGCALGNLIGGEIITLCGVPVLLKAGLAVAILGTLALVFTVPKAKANAKAMG